MLLLLQLVGAAGIPLKLTVLTFCVVGPKPLPVIVTDVPTGPNVGDKPETVGNSTKPDPFELCPDTVTTTG